MLKRRRFQAVLTARGSEATFRVLEITDFNQLPHVTLAFRAGNDAAVKAFLAGRLSDVKASCARLSHDLSAASVCQHHSITATHRCHRRKFHWLPLSSSLVADNRLTSALLWSECHTRLV